MLMKKVLITGAAGFIGFHLSKKMMAQGYHVYGLDNINDYYDVNLKLARLEALGVDSNGLQINKEVRGKNYIYQN